MFSEIQHNSLIIQRHKGLDGRPELRLCPETIANKRAHRRTEVSGRPECKLENSSIGPRDSMVQIKIAEHDSGGGFVAGSTMQDSATTLGLKATQTQSARFDSNDETLITFLEHPDKRLSVNQHLEATKVEGTLRSWTSVTNNGEEPVTLENLSSFVLSGITPFACDDAPGRLKVHRFQSRWSQEGRHQCETLEDMHLERNWLGLNVIAERFGQVGTMPVRKYFPFVAIEDTVAGVVWGAQLAWAGSWQMEVTRRGDTLSISGGLADYEFGHWRKVLKPGETFRTPVAHIGCIQGDIEKFCTTLVQLQETRLTDLPESEYELPVIFNEWCTNWGSPSHDKTLALARRLQGSGVSYLVIDDGWAKRPAEAKSQSNGDWVVDEEKFPHGLASLCQQIREMGFIPGIWFEFEVCNPGSKAFELSSHQLQIDGRPLQIGSRRYWDLNDPWVIEYLDQKLTRFLSDNGFGYLKVDYNDSLSVGCDHHDSKGEGLRHLVEGIHNTFDRLKASFKDLVIENCSSGGHRLEPSMMERTSMSSFSDAHESTNIPIIARQLHYLIPPRQSQIWAVLYPEDSNERFMYSLTATLYGRMCLSGPVHDLSEEQMKILRIAIEFYKQAAPIIRQGHTRLIGKTPQSWNHPSGWSGIWRQNIEGDRALIVAHLYEGNNEPYIEISLPPDQVWKIESVLSDQTTNSPTLTSEHIQLPTGNSFRGYAILLRKSNL